MPSRSPVAPRSTPLADLLRWKIAALKRVAQQLAHICSGPNANPKSFCLIEAVEHVVARDADPESGLGLHLRHMLTGAVAQQIVAREELVPRMSALFPGAPDLSFVRRYANSQWWCEAFCQLEGLHCRDVIAVVEAALHAAEADLAGASTGIAARSAGKTA